MTSPNYDELRAAYEAGETLKDISTRTGLSQSALSIALRAVGTAMRRVGRTRKAAK